jgi:hypothetical protein
MNSKYQTRVTRDEAITSFDDYPCFIHTVMKFSPDKNAGITVRLIDYSPHTVTTAVQRSESTGSSRGENTSTSRSSTVGSSTATTNSYGTTVTVGLRDSSVSEHHEHSQTETSERSATEGSESSRSKSRDISSSASMSIKDWGAYGWVEPASDYPCWIFGQEYPWDAVLFRQVDKNKLNPKNDPKIAKNPAQAIIPKDMLLRLYDAKKDEKVNCLYPPSQLSLFGINFVMKAVWLVTIPNESSSDTISIDHNISYTTASHSCFGNNDIDNVAVYIDQQAVKLESTESVDGSISTKLNFPLVALDPIGSEAHNAIVGFMPSKFTVKPPSALTDPTVPFKIVSATNDLMLRDDTDYGKCGEHAGFVATPTAINAYFGKQNEHLENKRPALIISCYFKIIDPIIEYTLHMKHWELGSDDIKLTIVVNDDNTIVKYVDAREGEGGEDNLLSISLRDLRYASGDFHDYLQLGLNCIKITIEPACGQFADRDGYGSYGIRAISIE